MNFPMLSRYMHIASMLVHLSLAPHSGHHEQYSPFQSAMCKRVEHTHDFILYGKGGEFASNKREDQEVGMLALHLLQVSLVYINTLMIQQVLAEPTWQGR